VPLSGTGTIYIEPGSPWDPSSFDGRSRDKLLDVEQSGLLAKLLVEEWAHRVQHLSASLLARPTHDGRVQEEVGG